MQPGIRPILTALRMMRKTEEGKIPDIRVCSPLSRELAHCYFSGSDPYGGDVGKRAGIVLVAGIAALTACSGSTTAESSPAAPASGPTSSTTALPKATTTTTTPEFSFDDSVPPPKLVNTGTNYVAILKSLEAYGNWAGSHRPDPELVRGFVAGGTNLLDAYVRTFTILRDKSQRFVERLSGPDQLTIISSTANAFSATVEQNITLHRVVDASGHVFREARFSGLTKYLVLAVRVGGRWYLASTDVTQAPRQLA